MIEGLCFQGVCVCCGVGGWAGFGLSFSPSCILFGRNFSAFSNTLLFIYQKKKKNLPKPLGW